jgi:hypothetical protein
MGNLGAGNTGTNSQDLAAAASQAEQAAKVNLGNVVPGLDAVIDKLTKANTSLGGLAKEIKESIESTETQVNSVSRLFAGSHLLAQQTRDLYRDVTPSVAALGGNIADVAKIQKGVLEGLQTQSSLNTNSYKELYAAGSLVAGSTDTASGKAAAMIPLFANAGYGINSIGKEMTGILNSAKDLGVTSVSVYKQMEGQMGKLAIYNFDGGVQGMAKMAAQASLLRIDMGKTLELSDTLFDPQKAIDMSSSFQRLGVQVSSLLDPYKLMDMSRNDPAKLQEEVGKALKSMTYFDEKTKSVRILPGAQGQLREIAKELNLSAAEAAKWAINAGDLDIKMREITFNPDFADEDSKKMIAGMAQLQTEGDLKGQYTVTLANGTEKIVSEVKKEDLAEIKAANEKMASPAKMQLEANGILKNIEGLIAARKGVVGQAIASDPGTVKNINSMAKVIATGQETINRTIGLQRESNDQNQINVKSISTNINKLTTVIGEAFGKVAKGDITGAGSTLLTGGQVALNDLKNGATNIPQNLAGANQQWGGNVDLSALTNIIQSAQSNLSGPAKEEMDKIMNMFGLNGGSIQQAINSSQIQPAIPSSTIVPSTVLPSQIVPQSTIVPQTRDLPETGNVKVDGSISVNVNPVGMESFVMDMLAKSDVASAIYQANSRTERMSNDLKGSGNNKSQAGNLFSPTTAYS